MGIRSSRCPDSGHQKQMSGERGYSLCFSLKYVPFVIAVGTALTGGPPHRSVHEELHSYGSCLESSASYTHAGQSA
jgi:hypothetical protein